MRLSLLIGGALLAASTLAFAQTDTKDQAMYGFGCAGRNGKDGN